MSSSKDAGPRADAARFASPPEDLDANAECIRREIDWFGKVLELRMSLHAGEPGEDPQTQDPLRRLEPPELPAAGAPYADLIHRLSLEAAERLLLVLGYIPHIEPAALDPFFLQNRSLERRFTEFGGLLGNSHSGFLPTGETAMFLLAGEDLRARLRYQHIFRPTHALYTHNVLRLDHRHRDEPPLSSALQLTAEALERLTTGRPYDPPFSSEFPAQRLTTLYEWQDLVLPPVVREDLEDIVGWARYEQVMMGEWGLEKRLKPGFRSLFFGPPGTGKTLSAALLSKQIGCAAYRIDLSKVVSKYIGETEKNLASLFDHAEQQDWILFFDEADSLFGKRTESRSANDRAANQQISYLLQRIEDFPGVVILATNQRSHLDEAFARRFQSMIYFPVPDAELRLRLWRDNFENKAYVLAPDVDLPALARDYELAGGSIVNVLRYACLKAAPRQTREIRSRDILRGIRKEMHKEGRLMDG